MELDHVEAFVAIATHGGFTRASSALHLRGSDAGAVTLAIVGTLASTQLTERLRRFREAHPRVDLRLRTALSAEVSELVLRGEATLGLRYEADPDPHLVSTIVHHETLIPVCSPRHRLARSSRVAPTTVSRERWLAFPPRLTAAREPHTATLAERLAANGLTASEVIHVDSLTAQKRMVEAGFGLALLPESAVVEELRARTLCRLRIPRMRAMVPVALLHRRRAFQSSATRKLAALLSESLHSRM